MKFISVLVFLALFASNACGKVIWGGLIYADSEHEHIHGVQIIPAVFDRMPVNVTNVTHTTFRVCVGSGGGATHTLEQQLETQLQQAGVREEQAKEIGVWAGGVTAYESRVFEFLYVDTIGSLLVKHVMCKRLGEETPNGSETAGDTTKGDTETGNVCVEVTVSSALGTTVVKPMKMITHMKFVDRFVLLQRMKREVVYWTTYEPRGLTQKELEHLVDVLSKNIYTAIKDTAPPTLKSILPPYLQEVSASGVSESVVTHTQEPATHVSENGVTEKSYESLEHLLAENEREETDSATHVSETSVSVSESQSASGVLQSKWRRVRGGVRDESDSLTLTQ
eukprot:GDKI01042162.1.p1 GENE.GDKI01042162.1~~GDKI01042162.1.p1  ORF type:complete len:337 (-),score=127.32 GDKI01042162.1:41-1051(-)